MLNYQVEMLNYQVEMLNYQKLLLTKILFLVNLSVTFTRHEIQICKIVYFKNFLELSNTNQKLSFVQIIYCFRIFYPPVVAPYRSLVAPTVVAPYRSLVAPAVVSPYRSLVAPTVDAPYRSLVAPAVVAPYRSSGSSYSSCSI